MDEKWMRKAIDLAKLGQGYVNPNPKVGAVIVKDQAMIGQGYHEKYGQAHAEINAINSVATSCEGATIYVTLEPCFHYGKTPPCVDAIIREKFSKVVIGMTDPNPKVSGKSVEKLKQHGIEVVVDVLKDECLALNPYFLTLMKEKRPYVAMKTAMTLDGKIATSTGESKWITGNKAREMVHDLRHAMQGIMVGINTVLKDDPMLTARRPVDSVQPIRIVVDSKGRLPEESRLLKSAKDYQTIIVTTKKMEEAKKSLLIQHGVEIIVAKEDEDGHVDLQDMMHELGKRSIDSLLLEGGGTLNDSMLRMGFVDEVISFIAPKLFGGAQAMTPVGGKGISSISQAYRLDDLEVDQVGEDIVIKGKVRR